MDVEHAHSNEVQSAADPNGLADHRLPLLPARFRKPRLRRTEARDYLEEIHGIVLAVATLAKLACVGGGPAYNLSIRTRLYPVEELDRWAMHRLGRLVRTTSDPTR